MTSVGSAAQASGSGTAAAPPIPGLEQGNPAVTNRQAPAPGTPQAAPRPTQPQTPQEIGEQIREQFRRDIQNGVTPVINVPDRIDVRNAVPQGAVDISVAFFLSIAAIIILTPLARAFARRMDAENQRKTAGGSEIAPQIEQLQQSVDAMAIELERITEAQRFQSQLLAGKPKEPEAARLQR